ncbi:MAG TPA: DNA-binding protein [Thermoanaerobaculia bacterium]|jgi:plasmid stability protein|nr:DNA-binding protein [Thermoanaerobaculia bacterium]
MARLIVRNVEGNLVKELELRAARNGHSAEEEHHQILRRALGSEYSGLSFKELLAAMPEIGDDRDFERIQDQGRAVDV